MNMYELFSVTTHTHTREHTPHRGKKEVKAAAAVVEKTYLGPRVREGEQVFGVAHIYASFNDTFVVCSAIHPPPHPAVSQRLSLLCSPVHTAANPFPTLSMLPISRARRPSAVSLVRKHTHTAIDEGQVSFR
jgi:hypothetical protein